MRVKDALENKIIYEELSNTEKVIHKYLAEHYEQIDILHVGIVAQECFCSTTSVHRTVKKLGYNSFVEFKHAYKNEKKLNKYADDAEDINNIISQINFDNLDKFTEVVDAAEVVYVYGVGGSEDTCKTLYRQLMLLGIPTIVVADIHLLRNIKKGLFISISNRGSQRLTVNATLRAKNNGMTIISITKENSILDKMSEVSITHRLNTKDDYLEREQLLHLYIIVNRLTNNLRKIRNF